MSDELDHALVQLRREADEAEIQNLRDRLAKAESALYAFGARVSDLERLIRDFKFYFMVIASFLGVLLLERAYGREAAASRLRKNARLRPARLSTSASVRPSS